MYYISATYSAHDNKLRLSALHRLDPATYKRVTDAGFIWAAKQDQFVAPAWTPEREDLALELAEFIDDEDSTPLDRAEDRAERFNGYEHRRLQEAERARLAVAAIADHIPLGQPILVGHHSEAHARRDARRIEAGMRRAVSLWRTAEYWRGRAAAALRHARYKERPDVRHRRIKKLEADSRKWERKRAEADRWLRLWTRVDDPTLVRRKDGLPMSTRERALFLADRCHLPVAIADDGRTWTAWCVLQPDEERPEGCPAMTPPEIQEVAREVYPARMAYCDRWITHIANRLIYERAMLDEQGGYQEPTKEKKTDLPLLNYPGTIRYRNRYYPGEVTAGEAIGITKAEWTAIHPDYKGTEVSECGTHRIRTTMMAPGHLHKLVAVFLTDSKLHARPSKDEVAAQAAKEQTARQLDLERKLRQLEARAAASAVPADPSTGAFQRLADQARAGVQIHSAPQLFPTPPALATRLATTANLEPGQRVLEPSCGTGNLLRAILSEAEVDLVAVEISAHLVEALRHDDTLRLADLRSADFLSCRVEDLGTFDRIVMNPPFSNGADMRHIHHARTFLRPGGLLVSLCASGPRQRAAFAEEAISWEELPAGSFKEEGTNVNVALVVLGQP